MGEPKEGVGQNDLEEIVEGSIKFWNNTALVFDKKRAREVAGSLLKDYYERKRIFSKDNLYPEGVMIKALGDADGRTKANALFFMTMLDRCHDSDKLWGEATGMYKANPKIFDAIYLSELQVEKLQKTLRSELHYSFVYTKEIKKDNAVWIIDNFKKLREDFEGDARKIVSWTGDIKEAVEAIKKFKGYRNETSNALATYLMIYGLASFDNPEELLQKIDFHDVNISLGTKMLRIKNYGGEKSVRREEVLKFLKESYSRLCKELGLNVIDLDRALWAVGSKVCKKKSSMDCDTLCPINQYCETLPKSYYKDGRIHFESDTKPRQMLLKMW